MSEVIEVPVAEETATVESELSEQEMLAAIQAPGNAKCFPDTFELAESLTKKVAWLTKVLIGRPIIPVLDNILFLNGVMYASDLQVTTMHYTEIKGEFLVDGKKLLAILKNLNKKDKVSFETAGVYSVYMIVNGEKIFTLAGENTGDYPKVPVLETNIPFLDITQEEDINNLQTATKYTTNDELRPAMTGVFLTNEAMCSTNGHYLFAKNLVNVNLIEPQFSFVIPKKAIALVKDFTHATLKRSEPFTRKGAHDLNTYTTQHVLIKQENRAVLARVIDERFPDYKNVIPQSNHITVRVNKKDLLQVLALGIEAANRTTHQMRMAFINGGDKVEFTAEDMDFNNEFRKKISGTVEWGDIKTTTYEDDIDESGTQKVDEIGIKLQKEVVTIQSPAPDEKFEIGFNIKFMVPIIKDTASSVIEIKMAAPNKAILVNNDILVMPVTLNQYT